MKIKELDINDRPREKIIKYGSNSLADYELLALLLDSGTKEESVIELSKKIIDKYGFKELFSMSFDELKQIKGIKEAKASKIMALFEITRRIINKDNIEITNSTQIYNLVIKDYLLLNIEMLSIVFINNKGKLIHIKKYNSYDNISVIFPIKEIIADILHFKAYAVVIVHNHPSGDCMPSDNDIKQTENFKDILSYLGIIFLDHLIISDKSFYSYSENKKYSVNNL